VSLFSPAWEVLSNFSQVFQVVSAPVLMINAALTAYRWLKARRRKKTLAKANAHTREKQLSNQGSNLEPPG